MATWEFQRTVTETYHVIADSQGQAFELMDDKFDGLPIDDKVMLVADFTPDDKAFNFVRKVSD